MRSGTSLCDTTGHQQTRREVYNEYSRDSQQSKLSTFHRAPDFPTHRWSGMNCSFKDFILHHKSLIPSQFGFFCKLLDLHRSLVQWSNSFPGIDKIFQHLTQFTATVFLLSMLQFYYYTYYKRVQCIQIQKQANVLYYDYSEPDLDDFLK